MADLTERDLAAIKGTLEIVISERLESGLRRMVVDVATDKFEKTLGVNCLDPDDREKTRKDMVFLRGQREYYESSEGAACVVAGKQLARGVVAIQSDVGKFIRYALLALLVAILAFGATSTNVINKLFGK